MGSTNNGRLRDADEQAVIEVAPWRMWVIVFKAMGFRNGLVTAYNYARTSMAGTPAEADYEFSGFSNRMIFDAWELVCERRHLSPDDREDLRDFLTENEQIVFEQCFVPALDSIERMAVDDAIQV